MIRIAQAFNVTVDYPVVYDAERRPFNAPRSHVDARLADLDQFTDEERTTITDVIDALVTRPSSDSSPAEPADALVLELPVAEPRKLLAQEAPTWSLDRLELAAEKLDCHLKVHRINDQVVAPDPRATLANRSSEPQRRAHQHVE